MVVDFVADPCGLPDGDEQSSPSTSPEHHRPVGLAEETAISGLVRLSDWAGGAASVDDRSPTHPPREHETGPHIDPVPAFPSCDLSTSPLLDIASSGSVSSLTFDSHLTHGPERSPTPIHLSDREARVVRHYIDNLAPWV